MLSWLTTVGGTMETQSLTPHQRKKLVRYWRDGAQQDVDAARQIIAQTRAYVNGLFFLHLAVEKALKGLYVHRRCTHAPMTHNLISLAKKCGLEVSATRTKMLNRINEFNLQTRYPDDRQSLRKRATAAYSQRTLKQGEEIVAWILASIDT